MWDLRFNLIGLVRTASSWRLAAGVVCVLMAVVIGGCGGENSNSTATVPTNSSVTPSAPPSSTDGPALAYNPSNSIAMPASLRDAELATLDGKTIKLSDYSGQVVILNLWATWCGPCRAETPELIELSKQYQSRGVKFIGIATKENEYERGIEGVRDFARGYQVPYDMVYTDGRFAAPLVQLVNARSVIPQSFVISKGGRFIAHFSGFNEDVTPAKMKAVIEQAVNEAPEG